MNLNINFRSNPATTPASEAAAAAATDAAARNAAAAAPQAPLFTVTRGAAAPEDIQAANLPPDTLSRDDELGRLVNAVFNLPPPPMPDFH